jgi:hypothetical protein
MVCGVPACACDISRRVSIVLVCSAVGTSRLQSNGCYSTHRTHVHVQAVMDLVMDGWAHTFCHEKATTHSSRSRSIDACVCTVHTRDQLGLDKPNREHSSRCRRELRAAQKQHDAGRTRSIIRGGCYASIWSSAQHSVASSNLNSHTHIVVPTRMHDRWQWAAMGWQRQQTLSSSSPLTAAVVAAVAKAANHPAHPMASLPSFHKLFDSHEVQETNSFA